MLVKLRMTCSSGVPWKKYLQEVDGGWGNPGEKNDLALDGRAVERNS